MFTFITCTYNHEQFIILHLESIKYQIYNHFKGIKVAIIISDDGSSDKTVPLCKKWLEKNRGLFAEMSILGDSKNRGTCKNIVNAFKHLKTDRFFWLAGDDVYGFRSLKKVIKELGQYELVTAPCLAFYDNYESGYHIEKDYNKYKTNISNGLCPWFMRRAFTITGCLTEAPSTVFRKELLDKEILDFVYQFKLIEDQPMIYQLFKKYKIKMKYLDYTYVIYRINPNSISHTNNLIIKSAAKKDLEKLCTYYFNEKNWFYKYLAWLRKQMINGNRWIAFFLPTNHFLVIRQKFFSKRIRQYYKKAIIDDATRSLQYLEMIDQYAMKFLKEIEQEI